MKLSDILSYIIIIILFIPLVALAFISIVASIITLYHRSYAHAAALFFAGLFLVIILGIPILAYFGL